MSVAGKLTREGSLPIATLDPVKDEETQDGEYHLDIKDQWVNSGRLGRA